MLVSDQIFNTVIYEEILDDMLYLPYLVTTHKHTIWTT